MKAVDYRNWPKPRFRRDCGQVGYLKCDFDAVASALAATPKLFSERATKEFPPVRYRVIFLVLSNGAPAALTQNFAKPADIELALECHSDEFVYDDDFLEVVKALNIPPGDIRKFEGNFTWLPNRKAKKISPKDEPLA